MFPAGDRSRHTDALRALGLYQPTRPDDGIVTRQTQAVTVAAAASAATAVVAVAAPERAAAMVAEAAAATATGGLVED